LRYFSEVVKLSFGVYVGNINVVVKFIPEAIVMCWTL